MIHDRRRSTLSIFSVSANALLSFGGYATGRASGRVPGRATVAPSEAPVDIGVFVGGSTFVGHGAIVDGAARLTLRRGLSGFVTMFVCVAGEVRGVIEALAEDGSLLVSGRDGFVDAIEYLESFGARDSEIDTVSALDEETARWWMTSLAMRGFVEGPPAGARRVGHVMEGGG
jgi:hypothetical protein